MTRLLSDVLHERADSAATPGVDLDAIVAAGDRRVRRGRITTGLAAAAVAAVLAGGAVLAPGLTGSRGDDLATDSPAPFAERRVGYALEDVVHWGSESFSVGAVVVSYVQTDDGFVYTTRDATVWLFDGTASQRIGHAANHSLRADDTGSLVAWVDSAEDGHPQYVVFDTHAMTEVARVDDDGAGAGVDADNGGSYVYALDGSAVYWRTSEGIARYDIGDRTTELVSRIQDPGGMANPDGLPRAVDDVANGRIAYSVSDRDGNRTMVGSSIGQGATEIADGMNATLSPDGRYVTVENGDQLGVYDATSGGSVLPRLDGYDYRFVYGWVDDDTAMTLAIRDVAAKPWTADLLACDVPRGECRAVSQVGGLTDGETVVVPSGDPST